MAIKKTKNKRLQRRKTKKRLGGTLVDSLLCYGAEKWTLNNDLKRRFQALETDYSRRSSRKQRQTNEEGISCLSRMTDGQRRYLAEHHRGEERQVCLENPGAELLEKQWKLTI